MGCRLCHYFVAKSYEVLGGLCKRYPKGIEKHFDDWCGEMVPARGWRDRSITCAEEIKSESDKQWLMHQEKRDRQKAARDAKKELSTK